MLPIKLEAPPAGPGRVLIVDDEPALMAMLSEALTSLGYVPKGFTRPADALAALAREPFDVVLADLVMPDMNGIDFLHEALKIDRWLSCVIITGKATMESAIASLRAGAIDYLQKPFDLATVELALSRALTIGRLGRTNMLLERNLGAYAADLESAVQELEVFSYSVAHDLRAPLRAIRGFGAELARSSRESLSGPAQRHLDAIIRNADQMDQLIEDLLQFFRLDQQTLRIGPVDMPALVAASIEEVSGDPNVPPVATIVGPLPQCMGDAAMLRRVFVNLLANAYKFSANVPDAQVEVGYEIDSGAFYVKDNGVGFDMAYAPKLFNVFQRLHSSGQFAGTGLGLVTVRHIVERHGGRVWADAAPGKGATFRFTLA